MLKYTLKRLLALIPVIIGVTFLIYFIMSFSPGDPARMQLGNAATEESVAQLRQEMGLDKPVLVQYVRYMGGLLRGDFGTSYITGQPVMREISACFPYTVKLALLAMALAVLISVPIGILSAMKQKSLLDGLSMVFALLGISMPPFWLGLMMILLFSVTLGWLPSGGSVGWTSYIMPAITVAVASMAVIARTTRSSMLEVIRQDYIRTARAKGVPRKAVIRRHAMRNAMIPTVTAIGLEIGTALGGAVLTETVFSWPGIGRLCYTAITQKNTPMVLACTLIFSVCFSIVNLAVDILYAYIDPRIKSQFK